jgi:hypothetical protein
VRGVVVDYLLGVEGGGDGVCGRGVEVGVVARVGVPAAGVVVGPGWGC